VLARQNAVYPEGGGHGADYRCKRIITARSTLKSTIDRFDCGDLMLLFGTAGGPSILRTSPRSGQIMCWIQHCPGTDVILINGQSLSRFGIGIVPSEQNFVLTTRAPCKWLCLSIPASRLQPACQSEPSFPINAPPFVLVAPQHAVRRLVDVATSIQKQFERDKRRFGQTRDANLEQALLDTFLAVSAVGDYAQSHMKRQSRINRVRIVNRALDFIEMHDADNALTVEGLCLATCTSQRTLLRAFRHFFDIGPARYMRLRQLNRVHWALRNSAPRSASIRNILISFNVTEFGRFAFEYKALFGESPSQTHLR
jgi:AraC family transcriptional regulator, ethanolamine operon transcriptional activator